MPRTSHRRRAACRCVALWIGCLLALQVPALGEDPPRFLVAAEAGGCGEVRAERTESAELIDCVPSGTAARGLERADGWWRVRLVDGREGWIHESALEADPAPAVPPLDVELWKRLEHTEQALREAEAARDSLLGRLSQIENEAARKTEEERRSLLARLVELSRQSEELINRVEILEESERSLQGALAEARAEVGRLRRGGTSGEAELIDTLRRDLARAHSRIDEAVLQAAAKEAELEGRLARSEERLALSEAERQRLRRQLLDAGMEPAAVAGLEVFSVPSAADVLAAEAAEPPVVELGEAPGRVAEVGRPIVRPSEPSPMPPVGDVAAAVVAGARWSVANRPEYDTRYYAIPYPMGDVSLDRGSSTDLVVRAFRQAGVDLQREIHEDVLGAPTPYGIDRPDTNIDHRRIRNLLRFFSRDDRAVDVAGSGDWQAGDVVFWDVTGDGSSDHIGIVSDRRRTDGRPLVIHHRRPGAPREEDALGQAAIVAHYRWRGAA